MKKCSICKLNKGLNFFYKNKRTKSGLSSACGECLKSTYRSPEEKIRIKNYLKKYCELNRSKIRIWRRGYSKKRLATDVKFKLGVLLRIRLNDVLKHRKKVGSSVRDMGCTLVELKLYLEKQFKEGMTWDNWGRTGWHIDHIKPLISFDLTNREELLKACHYINLQPLWAKDNFSKKLDDMKRYNYNLSTPPTKE